MISPYQGNNLDEPEPEDTAMDLDLDDPESYKDIKSAKNKVLAADRKRIARLEEVEDRINFLENRLKELSEDLAQPPDDPDQVAQLGHDYRELETELDILLHEWEELQNG